MKLIKSSLNLDKIRNLILKYSYASSTTKDYEQISLTLKDLKKSINFKVVI